MTPTPETDAQTFTAQAVEGSNANTTHPQPVVTCDFSKSLELRLRESEAGAAVMRAELERLRFELVLAQIPTTVDAVEREEWRQERDSLRRKVEAAEGMATVLDRPVHEAVGLLMEHKLFVEAQTLRAMRMNALDAWQGANK